MGSSKFPSPPAGSSKHPLISGKATRSTPSRDRILYFRSLRSFVPRWSFSTSLPCLRLRPTRLFFSKSPHMYHIVRSAPAEVPCADRFSSPGSICREICFALLTYFSACHLMKSIIAYVQQRTGEPQNVCVLAGCICRILAVAQIPRRHNIRNKVRQAFRSCESVHLVVDGPRESQAVPRWRNVVFLAVLVGNDASDLGQTRAGVKNKKASLGAKARESA